MGNEEETNAQQRQGEKKYAPKIYALVLLLFAVFFLFFIANTLVIDWLKQCGVIEVIECNDYLDEAVFSSSEKALVLASREIQATEKMICQTHFHLYFTTLTSRALLKVDYRAKINYAILPEPWEVEKDEKEGRVCLRVSAIFAQNIDVDYGSVEGTIDGGYFVRNEAWILEMMMRQLSRKALVNASLPESIEEVRELIRKNIIQMVQTRYGTQEVEVIFNDEIKIKPGEESR